MSTDVDPWFEAWWQRYRETTGRPGSKGAALKVWRRLKIDERKAAGRGIVRHRDLIILNPGVFVMPNGVTWLSQQRWMDDTPQQPPKVRSNSHPGFAKLRSVMEANNG